MFLQFSSRVFFSFLAGFLCFSFSATVLFLGIGIFSSLEVHTDKAFILSVLFSPEAFFHRTAI